MVSGCFHFDFSLLLWLRCHFCCLFATASPIWSRFVGFFCNGPDPSEVFLR
jgi:hypothetical protein